MVAPVKSSFCLRRLVAARRGSVSVYAALALTLGLGGGAMAVDIGRVELLRTQLQARADAGATAAATALDGRDGARQRATQLANNAVLKSSKIAADQAALTVSAVNFYTQLVPAKVIAQSDQDAAFAEVILQNRRVDFLFSPMLAMLGAETLQERWMGAASTAQLAMVLCKAPPMMICDPRENAGPDLTDPAAVGRQLYIKNPKVGGGTVAPGNFGLLAPASGEEGAQAVFEALAAVEPEGCYTTLVETETGSKTVKVEKGINGRFDVETTAGPAAPNVIAYPRDLDVLTGLTRIGDGVWDRAGYWLARHGGVLPSVLLDATRYQVYLYELGLSYAKRGHETFYPVPDEVPAGASIVNPLTAAIPKSLIDPDDPFQDGRPAGTAASNGQARRLLVVPLMRCVEDEIHGSGTYSTHGRYLEVFLTEPAESTPTSAILVEVVRAITLANSNDLHAYARVVE